MAATPSSSRKEAIDALLLGLPGVSAKKINGIDAYFVADKMFACLSHEGIGLVVDPQRDIDRFLSAARSADVSIQYVLETHVHNDYVSGGRELAHATGASLILPAGAGVAFDHVPAFHQDNLRDKINLPERRRRFRHLHHMVFKKKHSVIQQLDRYAAVCANDRPVQKETFVRPKRDVHSLTAIRRG